MIMSKARINSPGKKVRITLDVAEGLIREIDRIRESIGVDRGALIKIWLHERLQQENASTKHQRL
jgi:metal-responsive CopG/Arc/MetJ family transcriptional regulator